MAWQDFIKSNAAEGLKDNFSGAGAIFGAAAIADIATSDNKLKSILRTIRDIVLFKPLMAAFGVTVFGAMSKSVRSLVHDTGSLEAALKKLRQIQGLQQVFSPLVGGAEAAKKKVAELVNFASSKNLRLDAVGEAAKSLQVMTRGAFSGAAALDLIADAAAGTGNDIVSMSSAVGEFSNTLRSGGSIAGATEQLRQMGAVSNATADQIDYLQENGASADQIFQTLTKSLEGFKGGADKAKDSVAGVNMAYDAALESLKEKFASPFTESEIQNTKNWTDAMKAVAPVVERLAVWVSILTNGLSTAKSTVAKWVAESPALSKAFEYLIATITLAITIFGALGAINLSVWFFEAAAAALSFGGALGVIVATAAGLSGVLVVMLALATAFGIYKQFTSNAEQARNAITDLRKATEQANAALEKQIASIRTLADRHDALAAAIDNTAKAQAAWQEATKSGDLNKINEAYANLMAARHAQEVIGSVDSSGLAPGASTVENARIALARSKSINEQHFQNVMSSGSDSQKAEAMRGKLGQLNELEFMGKAGLLARAKADRDQADADFEVQKAQGALTEMGTRKQAIMNGKHVTRAGLEANLQAAQLNAGAVGSDAPTYSSAYLDRQARMAGNTPLGASFRAKAEEARQNEGSVIENGQRSMGLNDELRRLLIGSAQSGVGIQLDLARQKAQLGGNSRAMQGLDDFSVFKGKFDELLAQYGPTQAAAIASKMASNSVLMSAREAGNAQIQNTVVDSMARIGGGGNVANFSGGSLLSVAQRQLEWQEMMAKYLEEIAEAGQLTID